MKFYLKSTYHFLLNDARRRMKTVAMLLFLMFAAGIAAKAQTVTLKKTNASLVEVFEAIKKQTGYGFVYTIPQMRQSVKVNIRVRNELLKKVLDQCFANQPFTYVIEGKNIVVMDKPHIRYLATPSNTVTGVIKDKSGNKLPGVSIQLLGSGQGTVSDNDGQFTIQAPAGSLVRFSMIGYKPVEVRLNGGDYINITMEEIKKILNDLVVVGYGQQKREDITDAITSINSDQVTEMAATNLSQVFAGRVPGILARTVSGAPGEDNATLSVRTTDNTLPPLLVVDGVPRFNVSGGNQVGLNSIDPNEVESITILKDNAATAVYGSRGANGVILVTTKRGKLGKPQVSYNTTFTWSSPTRMFDKLNGYEYAQAMNTYYVGSGLSAPYSAGLLDTIKNQLEPYVYGNTDWTGLVLKDKKGLVQNHNLSIRGGNEAARYYISGSYSNQVGMFPTDYFKRYILQSNLDFNLSRDFKAQVNLGYTNDYLHYPGGGSSSTIVNLAANISPLTPAFMPNGAYGGVVPGGTNPLASASNASGYQYTSTNYITANGRITWQPTSIRGLSAYTNLDVEKNFLRGKQYLVPVPTYSISKSSPTGYIQVGGTGLPSVTDNTGDATTYTADFALAFDRRYGKHSVDALLLYTVAQTNNNSNTDRRMNLVAPGLDILNLGSTVNESTTGTRSQYARAGYVGRIQYNYDHRMYLEGSFREDGSTYFTPEHRWGFFPGGSAGWILSREKWFRFLPHVITLLKLRGSVGLTGDDNIGGYTYYYTYGIANTGVHNTQGYIFGNTYTPTFYLANSTLPNPNISWAKNLQTNIGVDALLWNGGLGISFDAYQKNRYDILYPRTYNLPATFGIGGPIQNFARAHDRGFELLLTSDHKLNRNWELSVNASITYVKTIYVDYGTEGLPEYERLEGHSPNSIAVYHALGIFNSQQEITDWKVDQDGLNNSTIRPGDIKFADLDGDGKITAADQKWINNYQYPPVNFGLGFDLKYKNIDLAAFFNGAAGGYMIYSNSLFDVWKYVYDHSWSPDNENAVFPRLAYTANNSRLSDLNLVKDDFLRLRDLRLSYALPANWIKAIKIEGMNVFAQASNLVTFTKVQGGIDPETPNMGTGGTSPNFYPIQRNIGFGLNVNF